VVAIDNYFTKIVKFVFQ